jgi:hypothetical protein
VDVTGLRAIGFWNGIHTSEGWPDVTQFVDPDWDQEERDFIVDYLRRGVLGRLYMGYSTCRICGRTDNGDSEYSDGTFVWPSGLAHYVAEHAVRLPNEFVTHASDFTEHLSGDRDETWWAGAHPV